MVYLWANLACKLNEVLDFMSDFIEKLSHVLPKKELVDNTCQKSDRSDWFFNLFKYEELGLIESPREFDLLLGMTAPENVKNDNPKLVAFLIGLTKIDKFEQTEILKEIDPDGNFFFAFILLMEIFFLLVVEKTMVNLIRNYPYIFVYS